MISCGPHDPSARGKGGSSSETGQGMYGAFLARTVVPFGRVDHLSKLTFSTKARNDHIRMRFLPKKKRLTCRHVDVLGPRLVTTATTCGSSNTNSVTVTLSIRTQEFLSELPTVQARS